MGERETVSSYLVRTLGFRRAIMVETFVMLWSLYSATEGHDPPSIEALGEAIGRNRSTLYRWRADFHEAFPQWSTPRELLDAAKLPKSRVVNVRKVGLLPYGGA